MKPLSRPTRKPISSQSHSILQSSKILKTLPLFLICGACNAGVVVGTGIFDLAGGDTLIGNAAGTRLTTGIAAIGYFSLSDADVVTTATNFQNTLDSAARITLVEAFTPLCSDDFVRGSEDVFGLRIPGIYFAAIDYQPLGADDPRVGKTLYTFLGTGVTLAASPEIALVQHTGVKIDPDTPSMPDNNDVVLTNPPTYQLLIGSKMMIRYDATLAGSSADLPAVLITTVPEASALWLGLFGMVSSLRRKR